MTCEPLPPLVECPGFKSLRASDFFNIDTNHHTGSFYVQQLRGLGHGTHPLWATDSATEKNQLHLGPKVSEPGPAPGLHIPDLLSREKPKLQIKSRIKDDQKQGPGPLSHGRGQGDTRGTGPRGQRDRDKERRWASPTPPGTAPSRDVTLRGLPVHARKCTPRLHRHMSAHTEGLDHRDNCSFHLN